MSKLSLLFFFHIAVFNSVYSQSGILSGQVLDQGGAPISGAHVSLQPSGRTLVTGRDGSFQFKRVNEASYLLVTYLGYQSREVRITALDQDNLLIILQERSLNLDEIVVTARENTNGLGTRSLIKKTAIEHVQPVSLRDVLQLLPGQLAQNPNLSSPQQILLRQTSTNSAGNRVSQLGTAVVLDGSPLSNDANLQYNVNILNSSPSTSAPFQSVAGRGVDLRQIPADQIESVEVIRGIPSARYGNFTSGAVLVETRIGKFDPNLRVRANPNLFQLAHGAGFETDSERQSFSYDIDVANSRPDPRDIQNSFTRLTGTLGHQIQLLENQQLILKNKLSLANNIATNRSDDENDPAQRSWESKDFLARWNASVRYTPEENAFADLITMSLSASYGVQDSYFEEFITTNVGPRPTFLKDTTGVVPYGAARYLNTTTVSGRPFNYYHRLEAKKSLSFFSSSHNISLGTEFRYDENKGEGRQFDLTRPPRQNYNAGDRPRSFDDVPALNQLSAYIEDNFSYRIGNHDWIWQMGLRLDRSYLTGSENRLISHDFQPRVNTAFYILPGLKLKAGYGINTKAPGLNYLSPGPRFFDLINFNYYAQNPAERLLIATTRRIEPETESLKSFSSEKFEFGTEGSLAGINFSIVYYNERTTNGPSFIRKPYIARYGIYDTVETPENAPPVLTDEPGEYITRFLGYDAPVNNRTIENSGLEYTIDFPEWKAINTSLNITGAYVKTRSFTAGEEANPNFIFQQVDSDYIPYYKAGYGNEAAQFNTSFRFIHKIPSVGLVISSLAQMTWIDRDGIYGYNSYPTALLDKNGFKVPLSAEEARRPEYKTYRNLIEEQQLLFENRPPLFLFNLRLSKEFGPGRGFAFYVNNFFDHNPLYYSVRNKNFTERNIDLFFGAELFFKL